MGVYSLVNWTMYEVQTRVKRLQNLLFLLGEGRVKVWCQCGVLNGCWLI